jgi:hypothetical protein
VSKVHIRETKYLIAARDPRAGTVLASAQRAGLRPNDDWVGWAVRAGDGQQTPLRVEIVDNITEARQLVEEWAAEELAAADTSPADDIRVVAA